MDYRCEGAVEVNKGRWLSVWCVAGGGMTEVANALVAKSWKKESL